MTRTEIVQVPGAVGVPAGMKPPDKLMVVFGEVETVPPQLLATGPATVIGLGKVSVKLALV